jgi:RNA polymerase sigma-B factor
MSRGDLDELATAYADAWTAATAARRGRLRNDLICRCLPFAGRMARRYAGRGEPLEDLQQVARIGLINAVDRYDPGRGSFTAFAVITVCGELKRHFRDKTWGLHVARRLRDLGVDLQHATVTLTNALQREPTIEELALHLDVSAEQIRHARLCGARYTPVPLSTPTGNDGSLELGDAFGDPDPDLEILTDKLAVTELVHLLSQRIQRMLALRFFGNHARADRRRVQRLADAGLASAHPRADLAARGDAQRRPASVDRRRQRALSGRRADPDRPVRGHGDGTGPRGGRRDTADQLRLSLHSAVVAATDGRLVIDVSGMPLADAAAVAVLRDAFRAAALAHVEVTLTAVQPHVAPVIATVGLA